MKTVEQEDMNPFCKDRFSLGFDTINLGLFIVYIEGSAGYNFQMK